MAKQVNVYLSDEMAEQLKAEAKAAGRSISQQIRWRLDPNWVSGSTVFTSERAREVAKKMHQLSTPEERSALARRLNSIRWAHQR